MTNDEDIISWIQLINSEGIGPVSFRKLLKKHDSIESALEEAGKTKNIISRTLAEEEYQKALDFNARILSYTDPLYPENLRRFDDAPPLIYAKGNLALLNQHPAIAMVGSRSASISGRKMTSRLAYELTENNILVVSGMARGIDAASHKGAMYAQNQKGPTVAVLGTGIDKIYPLENEELYHQIIAQGVIVSELPMGTTAISRNFPRRNRIVAALSDAVLVTEANLKSGSLITAHIAQEMGRKIFAVPGSPLDESSKGPNSLLRQGALWAECVEDIIKFMPQSQISKPIYSAQPDLFIKSLDNLQKTDDIPTVKKSPNRSILDYLTTEPVDIDEIIRSSDLDAASVAMMLIDLEMEEKIIRLPGNKIALSGKKMKVRR